MQKFGRPLSQLNDLKLEYVHSLNRLWLTTVEDLAGIIRLPEIESSVSRNMVVSLFANELGISVEVADKEVVQIIRNSIPDSEWYAMAGLEESLSFGLLFEKTDQIPHLQTQTAGFSGSAHKELPSRVNLLEQFPEYFADVGDQGLRGTCVAFAATGLHEYIHRKIKLQPFLCLSEEFLYWAARNIQYRHAPDTCHQCGTCIEYALRALLEMGQCSAEVKPYRTESPCNLKFVDGDIKDDVFICQACDYGDNPAYLATGTLTPEIQAEAEKFRLTNWEMIKLSTLQDIKRTLYDGYTVVIGVKGYLTWQSPTSRHSGIITLPFKQEIDDYRYHLGGHAILVIGYEDNEPKTEMPAPGGGYLIIRNSWGKTWGDASPAGLPAGYGVIPYAYLTRQFTHAYALTQRKNNIGAK